MDGPTLFVIGFTGIMLAVVLACIIATLVVNGRIRRKLQELEAEYMAESTAMVIREAVFVVGSPIRHRELGGSGCTSCDPWPGCR